MELPKDIKVLIFDFDGTLHNLSVDWRAVKRSVGIAGTNETLGEAIERFKSEKNVSMLDTITKHEKAALEGQMLSAEVSNTLKTLQKKYLIAILSRNSRAAIEHILEKSGLTSVLIIGREEADRIKPDPAGIIKILKRFNCTKEEAIMVGDTVHDIVASANAGIKCIIVGTNYKENKTIAKPAFYIKSISELVQLLEGYS